MWRRYLGQGILFDGLSWRSARGRGRLVRWKEPLTQDSSPGSDAYSSGSSHIANACSRQESTSDSYRFTFSSPDIGQGLWSCYRGRSQHTFQFRLWRLDLSQPRGSFGKARSYFKVKLTQGKPRNSGKLSKQVAVAWLRKPGIRSTHIEDLNVFPYITTPETSRGGNWWHHSELGFLTHFPIREALMRNMTVLTSQAAGIWHENDSWGSYLVGYLNSILTGHFDVSFSRPQVSYTAVLIGSFVVMMKKNGYVIWDDVVFSYKTSTMPAGPALGDVLAFLCHSFAKTAHEYFMLRGEIVDATNKRLNLATYKISAGNRLHAWPGSACMQL